MSERHLLQRHYSGWRPSLPDPRDLVADPSEIKTLAQVDPRGHMPAPYDQGQLGSCTANAVAGAIEYDRRLNADRGDDYTPSRLDIYYGERVIERSPVTEDTGAYGRDGFKFAQKTGVIPERDWPYDISKFADQPPGDVAHRHKIGAYKAVPRSIAAIKAVLSNRQTVAFGFSVFESFESDDVATHGLVPMPAPDEQMLGGHETLIVGYLKAEPGYALVRNSWGADWAIGGYFLMPWAYLLDAGLSDDFRTIYRPLGK